jgi:hypothetical protein
MIGLALIKEDPSEVRIVKSSSWRQQTGRARSSEAGEAP